MKKQNLINLVNEKAKERFYISRQGWEKETGNGFYIEYSIERLSKNKRIPKNTDVYNTSEEAFNAAIIIGTNEKLKCPEDTISVTDFGVYEPCYIF
jgi:hypothetical protein